MQLTIKTNFPDVQRKLDALGKQARFACAVALTRTAQAVKTAEIAQLRRSLDRPTPYTLNSLFFKPATRERLEARVWLKDDLAVSNAGTPPANYLVPHISGGQRHRKRFESALRAAGVLPDDWLVVPGDGARLDQFGNIERGQIIQILSQLRITQVAGYVRNLSFQARKQIAAQRKAGGRFFFVRPGGPLRPGVYQREFIGRTVTPVMIFVSRATYRKRLPFYETAKRVVAAEFPRHFEAAWKQALRTARWGSK